ncbi:MAG: thrombospondin type 3 repeat-containing protein [Nanoarchaeota archaeon]
MKKIIQLIFVMLFLSLAAVSVSADHNKILSITENLNDNLNPEFDPDTNIWDTYVLNAEDNEAILDIELTTGPENVNVEVLHVVEGTITDVTSLGDNSFRFDLGMGSNTIYFEVPQEGENTKRGYVILIQRGTDTDNDGRVDVLDNCPAIFNVDQFDTDNDNIGDDCDTDIDGDSLLNGNDNCENVANIEQNDYDGDGMGDDCDNDRDGDGVLNTEDTCPTIFNGDQDDADGDNIGDDCDNDRDGDGVLNTEDNCVYLRNDAQIDMDNDRIGDSCDGDIDGDGYENTDDNCQYISNPLQLDMDRNGIGNECDNDHDFDNILDENDNCVFAQNPGQEDNNNDGIGDSCDIDNDGKEDLDPDADRVITFWDNCREIYNPGQEDRDLNDIGNKCDTEDFIPDLRVKESSYDRKTGILTFTVENALGDGLNDFDFLSQEQIEENPEIINTFGNIDKKIKITVVWDDGNSAVSMYENELPAAISVDPESFRPGRTSELFSVNVGNPYKLNLDVLNGLKTPTKLIIRIDENNEIIEVDDFNNWFTAYEYLPPILDLRKIKLNGINDLRITIGGTDSDEVTSIPVGTKNVKFYSGALQLIEFDHDFSDNIDLSRTSLTLNNNFIGADFDGQLPTGETKILYLINNGFNKLCAKNSKVLTQDDISADCNQQDEIDFTSCLGNVNLITINGISCKEESGIIKIDGLSYSGIEGTQPVSPALNNGGGGGGGGRRTVVNQTIIDTQNSTFKASEPIKPVQTTAQKPIEDIKTAQPADNNAITGQAVTDTGSNRKYVPIAIGSLALLGIGTYAGLRFYKRKK